MSKTTIYAVRHGETEWNALGKQQGHLDSPLSERGKQQAQRLARGLSGRGIQTIYSSDLGRAQETANIIAEHLDLPVNLDKRLRERNLGILQGLTQAQFKQRDPDTYEKFKGSDPSYQIPEGESKQEHFQRCVSAAENIFSKHLGETILLVCHSGVVSNYFHRATQLPLGTPKRFSLINGAINKFEYSDDWSLATWGELSHLSGLEAMDDF